MAVERLERPSLRVGDLAVLTNPLVFINHTAKPERGVYREVPPWITLNRPVPSFREKISPEGWPPEYIEVAGEEWLYKCQNLWLLVQYLPDPYHMKYSHLGEFYPNGRGWSGVDETRTVRGFEVVGVPGQEKITDHWFIGDRRQLLAVYQGIPDRVVEGLFTSPRR